MDHSTPVIAKIEKHEAIDNIDEIINVSDGIMVARGDLGVEIPLENVPSIQKQLIRRANHLGKPVITATQMLRSMVDSPRPTRAEATDVANAVLDGSDAVMLSEETASGKYPVQAVRFMDRILQSTEIGFPHKKYLNLMSKESVSQSVAHGTCVLADHLKAAAIIAPTRSGSTAMHISRFRPGQPIIALSPERRTVQRLPLFWGTFPHLVDPSGDTDDMIENAAGEALRSGRVKEGDLVVMTAGHPPWVSGKTNMIRIKTL
jgi:pyruvate kinase